MEARLPATIMLQHGIRLGRIVFGVALILTGAVLSLPFVPGPGLLLVFGGLTVLGTEYHWARRLRERLQDAFGRVIGKTHGRREGPPG